MEKMKQDAKINAQNEHDLRHYERLEDAHTAKIKGLEAENERLRSMILYALAGPNDASAIKHVLLDAVYGVNGSENVDEVRATEAWKRDAEEFGLE